VEFYRFTTFLIYDFCQTAGKDSIEVVWQPIPLTPFPYKGRGNIGKRGGKAPSLESLPPLLGKERGIKEVRLINNLLLRLFAIYLVRGV